MPSILSRPVDYLEIPVRTINILKAQSIYTIGELVVWTEAELLRMDNVSRRNLLEIRNALAMHRLSLGVQLAESQQS